MSILHTTQQCDLTQQWAVDMKIWTAPQGWLQESQKPEIVSAPWELAQKNTFGQPCLTCDVGKAKQSVDAMYFITYCGFFVC